MTFVLERTQTEVFIDFKEKYPNVKISQRLYERHNPYFLIQARPCDRETCCCRYHVEARFLFKSCMDFRKSNTPQSDQYPVFTHLTELIFFTLCPKEGQDFLFRAVFASLLGSVFFWYHFIISHPVYIRGTLCSRFLFGKLNFLTPQCSHFICTHFKL
jgi:hypothetical protein